MTQDAYVLAGDVGGTNTRIAAVGCDGTILHRDERPTPQNGVASEIVDAIALGADSCLDAVKDRGAPSGFGLALAALVNSKEGRILSSPNLPELNDIALASKLSGRLDLKVVLENDATAAAIGEHWVGASKGINDCVCVTLGTGIGGGLILNGRPYRGVDGTAGEIGHICVEPEGLPCGCGSRGCVEQYASGTAIARIAREILSNRDTPSGLRSLTEFSAKEVYEAGVAGDLVSIEVFRIMGRYLGLAMAGIVDVLNPEMIVFGGGAVESWDLFIDHVRAEIDARAFRHPAASVQLARTTLGNSAGILGAACVAFDFG